MTFAASTQAINAASAAHTSSASALGGLDGEAFMQLLIAQLRYQSPLEPSDPTQLMMQTNQLAQLDTVQQLVALQRRDLGMHEAVAAANLLGVEVTGFTDDGEPIEGAVSAVRYTASGPVLVIDDRQLPLGAVEQLRHAEDS